MPVELENVPDTLDPFWVSVKPILADPVPPLVTTAAPVHLPDKSAIPLTEVTVSVLPIPLPHPANANTATLDNERDKYLRAQAAWEALATRENETQVARLKREADKLTVQEELS